MDNDKTIIINERLAQALLTLLRVGRFADVQFGELKAVDDALLAAVKAADVDVVEGDATDAVADTVAEFPAACV